MKNGSIILLNCLIVFSLFSQDNAQYFDVDDIEAKILWTTNEEGSFSYHLDGYSIFNFKNENKSIIINNNGEAYESSCDKIDFTSYRSLDTDHVYCTVNSFVYNYSLAKNKRISPGFDTIDYYSKNFYFGKKNDIANIYGINNDIIFELDSTYRRYQTDNYDNRFVSIKKGEKRYLLNTSGKLITEAPKKILLTKEPIINDHKVIYENGYRGIVNGMNDTIVIPEYEGIEIIDKDKYLVEYGDCIYGIIDTIGKVLLDPKYFRIYKEGSYFKALYNKKWRLYDTNCKRLFEKRFNNCYIVNDFFIYFNSEEESTYEIWNKNERFKLGNDIDTAIVVSKNCYAIRKSRDWEIFHKDGNKIFGPARIKFNNPRFKKENFNEIFLSVNDKRGILNEDGTWVKELSNNLSVEEACKVYMLYNGQRTLYNYNNKKIASDFKRCSCEHYGIVIHYDDHKDVINSNGDILISLYDSYISDIGTGSRLNRKPKILYVTDRINKMHSAIKICK